MALAKQNISLPFAYGIDTNVDDKQNIIGSIDTLENCILDTPLKLKKRNGYVSLSNMLLNGSSISDIKRLTTFRDELNLFSDSKFHAFSESLQKWIEKGEIDDVYPTSNVILRNTYQQSSLDALHLDGVDVYAWEDSRGGIRASIVDNSNGNFLLSDVELTSSGQNPRIANIFNIAYVVYIDGTNLKYRKINTFNPTAFDSEVTMQTDVNATDKILDAHSVNNRIFVGYCSSDGSGDLKLFTLAEDETTSSVITLAGETPTECLDITNDSEDRIVISWSDATKVRLVVYSYTLGTQIVAISTIETIANVTNVTSISNNGTYIVYYEVSAANTYNHYVKKNTIDIAASVGTPSVFNRSVGLASKAFLYNSNTYVTVVHDSELQDSYFVLSESGKIVGRISPSLGGGVITDGKLPNVSSVDSNTFLTATQIKGVIDEDGSKFFSILGVNSVTLDFDVANRFQNSELGPNLHISGGILRMYDGGSVTEHGFLLYPENLSVGSTATVGGSMSDGTYQYLAVYKWTDNQGLEHLSAPSVNVQVVLSGGTSTQTQTIAVPTLRITEKQNVVIDLYRTETNGTIYYKVTSVSSPEFNDTTVDSINITDTTSDTDLIDNEILYTTGGLLENISAPACSIIESFNARLMIAGLEDKSQVQYSKIRFDGTPAEFNDTYIINVDRLGGDIKALKVMDDKLIIFKETALYYISGDGPNNLGQQDTFTEPELLSSDIGCENPDSVVLTPEGLFFKSKKGIYLLNRGMSLSYIGSAVERFNDLTISSAVVKGDKNQVRFTTTTGDCLVYNYFVRKWSTFTNHRALSAVALDNDYYYVRPDSIIYKEDNTTFTDAGSPIKMRVETNWLSFAGVQGFQRVYRMILLGEYKSPHKLRTQVAYNFKEAFIHEKVFDSGEICDDTRYGEYSPYGDPSTIAYGGEGNLYQARLDLKIQKCQSIKIRLEDIQTTELGEGLEISNISFRVGAKTGLNKPNSGNKFGTS